MKKYKTKFFSTKITFDIWIVVVTRLNFDEINYEVGSNLRGNILTQYNVFCDDVSMIIATSCQMSNTFTLRTCTV